MNDHPKNMAQTQAFLYTFTLNSFKVHVAMVYSLNQIQIKIHIVPFLTVFGVSACGKVLSAIEMNSHHLCIVSMATKNARTLI